MNKLLRCISAIIYFFTAQLTVHAFTMHPAWHWDSDHHHVASEPDCWHPQPSHDHNDHADDSHNENHEDHWEHDMSMCLKQSIWAFTVNDVDLWSIEVKIETPHYDYLDTLYLAVDQHFTSLHDPWRSREWWSDWSFSKFLKTDLYGHGIIMHC